MGSAEVRQSMSERQRAPRSRERRAAGRTPAVVSVVAALFWLATAFPAAAEVWDFAPPACSPDRGDPLACLAPTIRVVDAEVPHNRVGRPELWRSFLGGLRASVDPDTPAFFVEERSDEIAGRAVRQLVYRIHFEKIPLRLSRYFFEAHRNPGLIVLLTQDVETGDLLFVSTAHTCGCYLALVPTDALSAAWRPEDWSEEQTLYGQRLPGVVSASEAARGVRVTLQSHNHRVVAIETGTGGVDATRRVETPLIPMRQLEALPIAGSPGETGSFFYTSGLLEGRVRGAWNAMEGLTLFGWISLDPTVGMDKRFGEPSVTGTRFYTQLPFWMHERSRLDRMDTLLRAFGYRLP